MAYVQLPDGVVSSDSSGGALPSGSVLVIGGGPSGDATAPGASVTGTGAVTGGAATGSGDDVASGATVTGTGTITGGTATGGAAGSFTFDACENNTHSGALIDVAVNWTWCSGLPGAITAVTNGSGTMTTSGMTISGLPAGAGCGLIRTSDGTVVAYQEGTIT